MRSFYENLKLRFSSATLASTLGIEEDRAMEILIGKTQTLTFEQLDLLKAKFPKPKHDKHEIQVKTVKDPRYGFSHVTLYYKDRQAKVIVGRELPTLQYILDQAYYAQHLKEDPEYDPQNHKGCQLFTRSFESKLKRLLQEDYDEIVINSRQQNW